MPSVSRNPRVTLSTIVLLGVKVRDGVRGVCFFVKRFFFFLVGGDFIRFENILLVSRNDFFC